MHLRIVPYSASLAAALAAFNQRLAAGGSPMRFRVAAEEAAPTIHQGLPQTHFLAVDAEANVRGGYVLKSQEFQIGPDRATVADLQLPISEGCVDRRYTQIASALLHDARRRQPLLYGLGMGGADNAVARLFAAAGWRLFPVPFYFFVVHPYRFLRNLAHYRRSALHRGLLDLFAYTGLGAVGFAALHFGRRRRLPVDPSIRAEVVDDFGAWADEVWQAGRPPCKLCSVRDAATLRRMYPSHTPALIRVRVRAGERSVGWVLAVNNQLDGHKHFGGMKLGAIVDAFAAPPHAARVIQCAKRLLVGQGADLIISNQSHRLWRAGLSQAGFFEAKSNFIFASSPVLSARMAECGIQPDDIHINRGDGDGPINLD